METRKVQRTGKSTFIVSLPKGWAIKNGIDAGSIVYITSSESGSLVLSPFRSERDLTIRLDIGDRSGEPLIRDIIACYVSGFRTIEVTSARMSSAQKKDVHHIVQKLIGPEILEETMGKVLIQDLLSSEELQSERALRRLRTVVKSMIQDSMTAMAECNRELAFDVISRDDDVDRLTLLMSRQFTEILRSGGVRQEELDPITAFNYMQAASNLERIADHAQRIAEMAVKCNFPLPDSIIGELVAMEPIFASLIDDSISSLLHHKRDRANEIIDQTRELRGTVSLISNSSKNGNRDELMARLVVSSSIERMLDYLDNIAELTINLSHSKADSVQQ